VLRFETVGSGWRLPAVKAPALPQPLGALSTSIEGRYKLRPGLYVAGRVDHLGFSDIAGTTETLPWDAPVTRVEIGAGYSLQRNLLLKGSYQFNRRDGGVLERFENFPAAQLVFWF
jgi:predicted porin